MVGVLVMFAGMVAASAGMCLRTRRTAINPDNVNAERQVQLGVDDEAETGKTAV
ncbi:hypothetical protein [Microlunatus ginsengisoli]|uniref:Uncharacterized protein n=1 Tax=Microlunatus ginsengisoli TaxID=363863 RepID=A0ABP7ALD4_9ACTN